MKKWMLMMLCIALLTPAVLAEEVVISPALEAKRLTIAAMKDKYGFTNDVLGLFYMYVTQEEDAVCVRLLPAEYLPADIVGQYEVVITGGQAEAAWSHDDQNPMYWQSDILDSPCWGARQLNMIRLSSGEGLDLYLPEGYEPDPLPSEYGDLTFERVVFQDGDLPPEEVLSLADTALQLVYNLPPEEIHLLDHDLEPALLLASDGQRLWKISLADPERFFSVLINAATGEVFDVSLSTGGQG